MAKLLLFEKGRLLNFALTFFASFFLMTTGWGQTVTSDKDDYAPGEVATISGSGWTGDNFVDVHFEETPAYHAEHQHDYHGTAVDANGNWEIKYQIEDRHLGVAFVVHVVGKQSGAEAYTYFTDGQISDFTISSQSITPASGTVTALNYTGYIKVAANQNITSTILLEASGLPPGVSLSPPSISVTGNYTGNTSLEIPITLTTGTTTPEITSPGQTFYVTATIKHPSNIVSTTTGSGTLIVGAPACMAPAVTRHPMSTTSDFTYGSDKTFSVTATGTAPQYQWQVDLGNGFVNISEATSATLTLTKPSATMNGYKYQCVVTNICGTVTSNAATLNIKKATATVTLAGLSHTYDGTAKSASATTDAIGTSSFTFTYDGASAQPINYKEGGYAVVATLVNDNYSGSASGSLTIGKAATSTVVTLAAGPFTYTGSAITPATVRVTGPGLDITPDAAYSNNTNAGDATASFSYAETANYLASADSKTFAIGKAATTTVVTLAAGPFTYTGSAITPATVSVTGAGGLNLTPAASYANNVDAGEATASYSYGETANYLASADSKTFAIGKAATTTVVTLAAGPFTYTGSAITPATVRVTGPGLDITPDAAYSNNTNAGDATASFSYAETANYLASADSKTFAIGKAATTTVVTLAAGPFTYTGSAITPATVRVTGPGLDITPDAAYSNNTNAGDATASFSYAETANYLASADSKTFAIGKAATTTVVTLAAGPFTYTGSAITPATVSINGAGGLNLTPAASYANNVDAGEATASYSYGGSNNYEPSSDSKTFNIGKAVTTTVVTLAAGSFTYTGSAITPATVSVTGAGGLNLTPAASYANNVDAGEATASYSYGGSNNYEPSSDSKTFNIGKAVTTTVVTLAAGPFTYTGSVITPATVSVTGAGGLNLTPAASYANNVDAGEATASYSYGGSNNYEPSSDSKTFNIGKAVTTTVVTLAAGPFTYTGSVITPATVSVTGAGGLNLTPAASYANNVEAGEATASYSYGGSNNYEPSSDSKTFNIGKAVTTTMVTLAAGPFTYTGSAITPATVRVTGAGGLNLTPDAAYSNNTNAGSATASFSYAETANYLASADSKTFTIIPKAASVTPNALSIFCGQTDLTLTGTLAGFVPSDNITATYTRVPGAAAGQYIINAALSPKDLLTNYTITYNTANYVIVGVTIDASASSNPVRLGTAATLSAQVTPAVAGVSVTFTLTGSANNNIAVPVAITGTNGIATVSVPNLPSDVYKVTAVAGGACSSSEAYLPVYDPNGGFVTGGGWITSLANAMASGVTGRANFGFKANYKAGNNNMTEVDGNTNFQFQAGDLHLKSKSHDDMSLVISGAKATYRGVGTVNGSGNHKFLLVAIDGDISGGGGVDRFRIKIWGDNSSTVLYDNQWSADENSNEATVLGGGSIVIHKPKAATTTRTAETIQTVNVEKTNAELTTQPATLDILGNLAVAPNPVQTEAKVRFSLIEDAGVNVRLFDFNGREIYNLYSGNAKANEVYEVGFQRNNLMSGIYIVKLTTDRGQSYTKNVIVE